MRPVVLGTAGHIDHGKTALVRRLTGIDTDRLKEEKERGISIDLGFAHLTLPSKRRVAIVDVPGHERFVKNMLAGATGIDLVLLVIAADEGVMPQTREHLAILDLLDVRRGVVALTKADLVPLDRLRAAETEARALLDPTALRGAPVVAVSSVTGEGLPELLREVDRAVEDVLGRASEGPVRLPIDRVFTVEGIGTVVTGTLWSGAVRPGMALEVLPQGRPVRVRQVEVHDTPVAEAAAGNRTALALHGVSREDLSRGDWLVTPGRLQATELLDVRIRLLAEAERPLEQRARVRIHLGASEVLGRVVLYGMDALPPGEKIYAQLRLEAPLVAVPRDRLVLRRYSPAVTIGGATVLDPSPARRGRLDAASEARLLTFESGSLPERVLFLAREGGASGVRPEAAAMRLGAEPRAIHEVIEGLPGLVRTRDGRLLAVEAWSSVLSHIEAAVRSYAEEHRLRSGIRKGELKSLLSRDIEGAVFDEALEKLLAGGKLGLEQDRVSLPESGPRLTPDQMEAVRRIEDRLGKSGFQVPDLSEVLLEVPPAAKPGELARYLVESGRAVRVTSDLLYPTSLWAEIESRVRGHFARRPTLTMSEFKNLLQVSRKYAVPVLEHLDRTGFTRREGDLRVPGPRSGQ